MTEDPWADLFEALIKASATRSAAEAALASIAKALDEYRVLSGLHDRIDGGSPKPGAFVKQEIAAALKQAEALLTSFKKMSSSGRVQFIAACADNRESPDMEQATSRADDTLLHLMVVVAALKHAHSQVKPAMGRPRNVGVNMLIIHSIFAWRDATGKLPVLTFDDGHVDADAMSEKERAKRRVKAPLFHVLCRLTDDAVTPEIFFAVLRELKGRRKKKRLDTQRASPNVSKRGTRKVGNVGSRKTT